MKNWIRRSHTLPERAVLSGMGNASNPIRRMSERRLVRKISRSFNSDKDDECEEAATTASESCGSDSLRPCCYEDFNIATDFTNNFSTAPLNRKELILKELLGVGTFSQVFAVSKVQLQGEYDERSKSADPRNSSARQQLRDVVNDRSHPVVVKQLNRKLLRRPQVFLQAALHLEQEAKLLSEIDHPNIVRLRGLALGGTMALQSGKYNDYFLVLDRLADTLDARIEQWKATAPAGLYQKVQYAQQLASALAYLHKRRLIFRDGKPQNVGFLADGTLQLFDFGFCRALPEPSFPADRADQETFHMSMAGTTRYMAPEVQQLQAYNCKADVYSWALTVYEMLAEEKPFADFSCKFQFTEFVCAQHVRPNLQGKAMVYLPASLKQLLIEAWCGSVKQRLTMQAVLERLTPILNDLKQRTVATKQVGSNQTCLQHVSMLKLHKPISPTSA